MQIEIKELTLPCIECGAEVEKSAMLEFGGFVACEKCVRAYYRKTYGDSFPEFSPADVKKSIEDELQARRFGAVTFVKHNRRQLEKQAARMARYSGQF